MEILDTRAKVYSIHSQAQTAQLAKDNICYLLPNFAKSLHLNVNDILNSIDFDKKVTSSNRYTAYLGNVPYSYSYAYHKALNISENPLIETCLEAVNNCFDDAELNTVLINYYPDGSSKLNFHSDDEVEIVDDSFIFTLSLGHSRNIVFRSLEHKIHIAKVLLEDSSLLLFSKASQHIYQHAILPETGASERISLTFRKLKNKIDS